MLPETQPKGAQTIDTIPIKHQAIALLQESGLKNGEIAKALNISDGRVSQVKSTLKKIGLTGNVKRYKNALKAHDKIVKTFLDSDINDLPKALKISDVNTRIDSVLDRNDAVVRQTANLNVNMDISPVDLSNFKNKL